MNDYSELKRLAESCKGWDNMTSCWPDQEQDGDADISWIVGHVGEDGDKYPVLELNTVQYDAPDDAEKLARFYAGANPAAVLAMIAEMKKIDADRKACWAEFKVQGRQVDRLKAENEALRKVANELRWSATCEHMHHDKPDWHEYDEPCKVLARIDAVLGGGGKSGD